jgi:LTXXQ motif family protein
MTLRQTISVLSLVLLPFASAACGRHARGHHGYHMMMAGRSGVRDMHHMHRGMGDPVAQLLDHQAALKLTSAQMNSLISIDEKLIADNRPLRDRLMALRPPMGGDRGKKPDSASAAARIPQRDSAAAVFQQMRENRWRAMNAAYGQLTEEQMSALGRAGGGGRPGGFRGGFEGRGGPEGGMRDGGPGSGRTGGGRPHGGGPAGPPSGSSGDQE